MEKRKDRDQKVMNKPVPPYARLFFDHLYSEYVALKPSLTDADANIVAILDEIHERRRKHDRSEEHTSELQSRSDLVCRLLLEKKKKTNNIHLDRNTII